jgi:hypothetical protein
MNRRNIIPVVKLTIPHFSIHKFKLFSQIIIEGEEELIRIFSVEGQPTNAVLAQTNMGVLFIRLVSDTTLLYFLSFKAACIPQFHKNCFKGLNIIKRLIFVLGLRRSLERWYQILNNI